MSSTKNTLTEYCQLTGLNLKVKVANFLEYIKVVFNYYSNPTFLKIDTSLLSSYVFNSPFRISKRFLLSRGEQDIFTYGETPLTTLEKISKECRLSCRDVVFELGCGRGRTCFWLNQFVGCSVVGIDYVPKFIQYANRVKQSFAIKDVEFREEDLMTTDLKRATVIYLYGTCFTGPYIESLVKRFKDLPRGTKIITVSYSLLEYVPQAPFEILKRFPARFTWGEADVYLHIKK